MSPDNQSEIHESNVNIWLEERIAKFTHLKYTFLSLGFGWEENKVWNWKSLFVLQVTSPLQKSIFSLALLGPWIRLKMVLCLFHLNGLTKDHGYSSIRKQILPSASEETIPRGSFACWLALWNRVWISIFGMGRFWILIHTKRQQLLLPLLFPTKRHPRSLCGEPPLKMSPKWMEPSITTSQAVAHRSYNRKDNTCWHFWIILTNLNVLVSIFKGKHFTSLN